MTVLGPVDPGQLGITLPHEHLLSDATEVEMPWDYLPFKDEAVITEELGYLVRAGGGAIVDLTNHGIGRDPDGLVRISRATGLHVIMGTGWYREAVYPDYVLENLVGQLADALIDEIVNGVGDARIRPGVIGEIGTERKFVTPAAERVFRAAGRASAATNIAISTHCTGGRLAMEQLAIFAEEGVAMDRVIIGHQGRDTDITRELAIAARGPYVQIDLIGAYPHVERDRQMAANVATLARAGYLNQILISQDTCMPQQLHWLGGHGYDYLLTDFVPMLRDQGLEQDEIDVILRQNPGRALDF